MRIVFKFFIFISFLALIGCSSLKQAPYETPSTGATAKIRIDDPYGSASFLFTFDESSTCTNRKQIFIKESGITDYKTIRAEEDFAFTFHAGPSIFQACSLAGILKPKKDGFYSIKVGYTKNHCVVNIYRTTPGKNSKEINVPYKKMKFVTAWNEAGSWCKEPDPEKT